LGGGGINYLGRGKPIQKKEKINRFPIIRSRKEEGKSTLLNRGETAQKRENHPPTYGTNHHEEKRRTSFLKKKNSRMAKIRRPRKKPGVFLWWKKEKGVRRSDLP